MKHVLLFVLLGCSRETTAYRVDVPPPLGSALIVLPLASAQPSAVPAQHGFHQGQAVEVEWHGEWWPAHILEARAFPPMFVIHYDGYEDAWDEEVGLDRIRAIE